MARPDSKRTPRSRTEDVGREAVRRLKEILRAGAPSSRPLLPPPSPPNFEEKRPLRFMRRPTDESDEE